MKKENILQAALKYIKDNGLKYTGDITDFIKANKDSILAHQAKSQKAAEKESITVPDISKLPDSQKVELLRHLDTFLAKTEAESKAKIEKRHAESKAFCEKINADTEKTKELAANLKAERLIKAATPAAKAFIKHNAAMIGGDIFDNRRCNFATPETIHKIGDKIYVFGADGNIWDSKQICICHKKLKKQGADFFVRTSGINWTEKLIKQLEAIEESLQVA